MVFGRDRPAKACNWHNYQFLIPSPLPQDRYRTRSLIVSKGLNEQTECGCYLNLGTYPYPRRSLGLMHGAEGREGHRDHQSLHQYG